MQELDVLSIKCTNRPTVSKKEKRKSAYQEGFEHVLRLITNQMTRSARRVNAL